MKGQSHSINKKQFYNKSFCRRFRQKEGFSLGREVFLFEITRILFSLIIQLINTLILFFVWEATFNIN